MFMHYLLNLSQSEKRGRTTDKQNLLLNEIVTCQVARF